MHVAFSTARVSAYQPYVSRAMAVLCGVCTLSVFLYSAFLLLAVQHTAVRTSTQKQISSLMGDVNDLQMHYLEETKTMTPARAAALGFVAPGSVTTVFATSDARSLSLKQ